MKIKLLLLSILLINTLSFSQNSVNRIEFDLKNDYENHIALPLKENGVLIQSTATKPSKGQLEIKNEFYDTDFKLVKSASVLVKDRTEIIDSYQQNSINYSLIRNKRDYVAIVISDAATNTIKKVESEYTDEGTLTDMKVHNNKAIFKSVIRNQSKIIIIDLNSGIASEVPFKFGNFSKSDIQIEDFQVLENEIIVFVNAKNSRRSSDLYIAQLDLNGVQKDFYRITDNIEEKLIEVAATKIGAKYILTGTYSKTKADMSQGIFIAEVENKNLGFIKFYNFLELKNFSNYMSESEARKIERRMDRAADKNKELVINYFIENHDIKLTDDGYIFLGEAYYPTYITYGTGNGGYVTKFDGYYYTHALISKFDKQGNLIWDNSFEIHPGYKPMALKRFISIKNTTNDIDLSFGNLKEIIYKKIDATTGTTLIDDTAEIIDTGIDGDKLRRSFSEVSYWYNNFFIAHGTQTVTNNDVKRGRKIFFVNKIILNKN